MSRGWHRFRFALFRVKWRLRGVRFEFTPTGDDIRWVRRMSVQAGRDYLNRVNAALKARGGPQ